MKELLLAKANTRKAKGLTVGLIILIMLASCFLNVVLLINFDFNKNAVNTAKRLNTEDTYLSFNGDISGINDDYIKSIINDDVASYEVSNFLATTAEIPYGDGTMNMYTTLTTEKVLNKKIGKSEIVTEDSSIKENYIYLPYQFYTGGGIKIGDDYKIKIENHEYTFRVKGFINNIIMGSNNVGNVVIILSDDAYVKAETDLKDSIANALVSFKLKDGVNATRFMNNLSDKIISDFPTLSYFGITLDDAIMGRTFLGIIFSAILLVVSLIILVIVILMISNNISNFIRENMKSLGALKALGYTNRDIVKSFLAQFMLIDVAGSFLGIILSIFLMQLIGNIMVVQSGIPYTAHFSFITVIITYVILFTIVMCSLLFFLRKTKKIEPITALKEGSNVNSFKKNVIKLEKTKMSLNVGLALKTTLTNIKQNIVTFVITLFLIFMSTLGFVLFQNFGINPKLSIMTFEVFDGAVSVDEDSDRQIYNYINNLDSTINTRLVTEDLFNVDDTRLMTYIIDDAEKLNNKDSCYEGMYPTNGNEIVVSGKFASDYNYKIGDEVTLKKGSKEVKYKITGFMQSLNNSGQEAIILNTGAEKLVGDNYNKAYYFEVTDDTNLDDVINNIENTFGSRIKTKMIFEEQAKSALDSIKVISAAVVILVLTINVFIILLVLYMLIKTLIIKKKKDYGILKSLGHTSNQIMFQNALSFMPTIILSVIISSVVSYFTINSVMTVVMKMFGIMKLTLVIPTMLIIISGIAFIIISFIFALLLSRRIKKIEPYKLLIGE